MEQRINPKNSDIWAYSNLKINNEEKIDGSAYTEIKNGYDIVLSFTSYELDDGGINHVPHVVVSTKDGTIVNEPHVYDSTDAQTAFERGKDTVENMWKNGDFI